MAYPSNVELSEARWHDAKAEVERLSSPGHDRDCATAMLSQANLERRGISTIQVQHLLQIGHRAGRADQLEAKREALRDARAVISQYVATAERWRYDRVMWAFAVMIGEVPEETPQPPSPADPNCAQVYGG